MRLTQSYKAIVLVLLLLSNSFLLSKTINPVSPKQEEKINLVIDTDKGIKEREYYDMLSVSRELHNL